MTVNVITSGEQESKKVVRLAKQMGYHAYYSKTTCAIEIPNVTKRKAREI